MRVKGEEDTLDRSVADFTNQVVGSSTKQCYLNLWPVGIRTFASRP